MGTRVEDQNFFQRGAFFHGIGGGGIEFSGEKIDDRLSQTDCPPPSKK